ncbi:MAG: SDR family NAD(P)-dependent oxidoreductase [Candidatus Dormibacteria bacterium]
MTKRLEGDVALVTGASRGIGRGVAVGLGEAGAVVYVTGRTVDDITATADLVNAAGGTGIAITCDHFDDANVAAVFAEIIREQDKLDLLVNNATALPEQRFLFGPTPFWDVPMDVWDGLFDVGVRSYFVAAQHAARVMLAQGRGLIVNVSSAGARHKFAIAPYGVAKAAVDRLTEDMAAELTGSGVVAVSVWPPPTSTEKQLANVEADDDPSTWSAPVFNGRVVAALAKDPNLAAKNGKALRMRDLATEYGVKDLLGQRPGRPA